MDKPFDFIGHTCGGLGPGERPGFFCHRLQRAAVQAAEQLCQPLRCEVAPYRQIGDVAIESASFNKARGDGYQLSLSMKSKAAIAVATPAVELTLTDAQDQPVLRRVLLPADMAAPAQLQPGGSWSTSVAVVVTTGGARVVGYRLLPFYP